MGEATVGDDIAEYCRVRAWLIGAVHELPTGILDGQNGATIEQCAEMRDELDVFATLCECLGLADHREFIAECRWHFEHYAHYLGRRRHFVDYPTYVADRGGSLRVRVPPEPRLGERGRT